MKSGTYAADRARLAEIAGEVGGIARELEDLGERLGLPNLRLSVQALRLEEANIRERLNPDPASVLPTEIISEIFVHVLPAYPICPPLAGKSSPTQLTHVCRQWREIALSTPSLWRAITIPFLRYKLKWDFDLLKIWLRRSGSCPLSLDMKTPIESVYNADTFRASMSEVFGVIVLHRTRWQYLSLCLGEKCDDLLEIIGPMPLLREMKLDLSWFDWDLEDEPPLPTVFCEAPHLRSMTYAGHTFPSIGFPWSQLTSLSLVKIDVDDCAEVLRQTVNLVQCTVSPITPVNVGDAPGLKLPHLESLELLEDDFFDDFEFMKYLGTFVVPALLRLQVPKCDSEFGLNHFFQSLSAFIAKAGCNLQEFRITSPSGYPSRQMADYRRELAYIPRVFYNDSDIFLDEECETSSDDEDSD